MRVAETRSEKETDIMITRSKVVAILAAGGILIAVAAVTSGAARGEKRRGARETVTTGTTERRPLVDALTKKLDLTEEQQSKVAKILEDSQAQTAKLAEQGRKLRESTQDEIAGVLDEKQKSKFNDMKAKFRGRVGEFI